MTPAPSRFGRWSPGALPPRLSWLLVALVVFGIATWLVIRLNGSESVVAPNSAVRSATQWAHHAYSTSSCKERLLGADAAAAKRSWCKTKRTLQLRGYELEDGSPQDCTEKFLSEVDDGSQALYGNPGTGWCVQFPLSRSDGSKSRLSVWVYVLPPRNGGSTPIVLAGTSSDCPPIRIAYGVTGGC